MWWVSVYWLTQSATHCWLALLSHVLCHLLYWARGDYVTGWSGIFISEQWLLRLDAGLSALVIVIQCIMGALRMTASAKVTAARNSSVAWDRSQMVWKCVWVFSLARSSVCESRCYSDCTKASEYLITQKERDEEKCKYDCWITGLYRPSLTNASSCHLILGRFVFVLFQYPDIWCPCAHNAAWGKQGFFEL